MIDSAVWAARPDADFSWHEWDGEAVVFVAATGATHELSPLASLLLKAMRRQPGAGRPQAYWFDLVCGDAEGPPAAGASRAEARSFEQLLHGLQHIGLVQPQTA